MQKLKGQLYAEGETTTNYRDDDYEQLTPGAYVCKFSLVRDEPSKGYLYAEYDIAEGEHEGYYARLADRAGFWGGRIYLSYSDKALRIFTRAIKAINNDNPGYEFNPFQDGKNNDERTLVGKQFGIVLHEEEYTKNDGSIGTRLTASATAIVQIEKAKAGTFNQKLLEKTISTRNSSGTTSAPTPDFMDSSENPFE